MEVILNLLQSDTGMNLLLGIIASVFGVVKALSWTKQKKLDIALDALEIGVRQTYEGYVKSLKMANQDGKLTDEEKKTARDIALTVATAWAKTQGVNLAKVYAKEYLPILVEKLVRSSKMAGDISKNVVPFSPGAQPLSASELP